MPRKEDILVQTLAKIDQKIDGLDSRLDLVDRTLVKQEANLGEHMRRTELAEKAIENVRVDLEPLKKHKAFIEGVLKAIGLITALAAAITVVSKIF